MNHRETTFKRRKDDEEYYPEDESVDEVVKYCRSKQKKSKTLVNSNSEYQAEIPLNGNYFWNET